jgi:hypothetical protein
MFSALGTTLKYASFVFLVPVIVAVIYSEYFAIPYFFLTFSGSAPEKFYIIIK